MELEEAIKQSLAESGDAEASGMDNTDRDFELALKLSEDPDISNDFKMALQMQREFDREDEILAQFEESKKHGGVATG